MSLIADRRRYFTRRPVMMMNRDVEPLPQQVRETEQHQQGSDKSRMLNPTAHGSRYFFVRVGWRKAPRKVVNGVSRVFVSKAQKARHALR